jgi:flagellar protein FliS
MQKAAHAYLQTNLTTNSPGEIVIMLYDGAINFLNRAKEQIDARDYAGKGISISKATDIINELSASLNAEKGGELAENLSKLYFWCIAKLAMANLKLDNSLVDSVIKVLTGLKSAYVQIQGQPEAQEASSQLAQQQDAVGASSARTVHASSGKTMPLPPAQHLGNRGMSAYSKMALA